MEDPYTGQRDSRNTGHKSLLGLITNQSPATTLETWHRRLCHRTLDSSGVNYIASRVIDIKVNDGHNCTNKICEICTLGRQHREAETNSREKAGEALSVVHTDIGGAIEMPNLKGEWYFITFTDETTCLLSISVLHSKDQALAAFQVYRARAEKASGKEMKSLRSDGGAEYMNQGLKKYLESAVIQSRVTTPHSPAQNGLAERMNRTVVESARCMLEDSKLQKEFWGPAILTAGHIHNRLPSRSHGDISPNQHWTGQVPGIWHL